MVWDCAIGTPEEDHEWEFVDDSFDHEYGTEQVHYWRCKYCDKTREMEAEDEEEAE